MSSLIKQLREAVHSGFAPSGKDVVYMYSPLCGTCNVASRMLDVIESLLPELRIERLNINEIPDLAKAYQIESVPCLCIWRTVAKHPRNEMDGDYADNMLPEKVYAFHSIPYLYERLGGGKADDSSGKRNI